MNDDGPRAVGWARALGLALVVVGLWILVFSGLSWLVMIARDSHRIGRLHYSSDLVGAFVGAGLCVMGAVAVAYAFGRGEET